MSSKSVNKTPSKYELSVTKVIKTIRKMLPGLGQGIVTVYQAYIGGQMGLSGAAFPKSGADYKFSPTPGKLNAQTGKLYRSFGLKPDNTGESMTEINVSGDKVKVIFGSRLPYAKIQDTGGFVRSKGKMAGWLMYKYIETGNPMFLATSLSVKKKGGIDIKATHYFTNATADFSREGMPFIAKNFNKEIKAELKKIGL